MSRLSNIPTPIATRGLRCLWLAIVIPFVGCTVGPDCLLDIGHVYEEDDLGLEMVLNHDCSTGTVTGTFYDADSFAYELLGDVRGESFSFSATRARPSGTGTDEYRSPPGRWEILSGGVILRGTLFVNGIGGRQASFRWDG